ncbi:MAG: thiamine pyrophosphate-dependent dehydrogenase E1 component subunit alpha [Spirochaetota bacterium]
MYRPVISQETVLKLYTVMVLLRKFENNVAICYGQGEIPGFVHLYQGEEAVAAGVCTHLADADVVASTHRGHGHVLAKGCDIRRTMAELYAKETGLSGGRGGSMHMYDKSHGLVGTNGIVGGGIPMALGAGLTFKTKKTSNVAVTFFGDGASNMGILYESLNLAASLKLPVIFVCENNLYATSTPLKKVAANPEIATRAAAFNMPGVSVNGNDVLDVFIEAGNAVRRARNGEGPTLIEAKTYRQHGHHEGDELYGTYRTKEEVEDWKNNKDPLFLFKKYISEEFPGMEERLDEIEREADVLIQDAVDFARKSEFPQPKNVREHLFRG